MLRCYSGVVNSCSISCVTANRIDILNERPEEPLLANMPKRNLRVVKWLSSTPAIGECTCCSKEFKVPMTSLGKTIDAQTNLQEQFDRHKCPEDANES